MHFQAFITGSIGYDKIIINKRGDLFYIEFQDIPETPKGIEYNLAILLEKVEF